MLSEKAQADKFHEAYLTIEREISKVIIGQPEVVKLLLTSIFCEGHSLLVGVPGLAKTLLIKTLASVMDLSFSRIQFTPDLMPSDIIGSETLDKDKELRFLKGPVFANIILADEINRTPPKTQSSLLESMQEYAVTVGGETYSLDKPFFVLATQNPIEQEGTYPLPEAQLDRFMFMINLEYPSYSDEVEIIKRTTSNHAVDLQKIIGKEDIDTFQQLVRKVPVTDNVVQYAVSLVHKTRASNNNTDNEIANTYLEWGAGPRASQFLIMGAKCNALINGKYSPDIEDVQQIAKPILRHRLVKNFKADSEGMSIDDIIAKLL